MARVVVCSGSIAPLSHEPSHRLQATAARRCAEIFHHYNPDPEVYRGAIALLG